MQDSYTVWALVQTWGLLRREAEMAPLLVSLSGRMGVVITEDKSGSVGAGAQVTAR